MTVDELYGIMQYVINKEQSGYLTPDDFNRVSNQGQLMYQSFLIGEPQQYQLGRSIPRIGMGMNSIIKQKIDPFIKEYESISIDGDGKGLYPADFVQLVAMNYGALMQRVRYIQQDSLWSYLNSVIDPVASNPIFYTIDTGFQFYPKTLGSASLSYIRKPTNIVWAYTEDVNGRPVYDPTNSVDPEWNDIDCMEVIVRALGLVGVNLQAPMVEQYANMIKNGGK